MPDVTWPWAYGGSNTTAENARRVAASLPVHELWYGDQARVSAGEPLRVIDWLEVARLSLWLSCVQDLYNWNTPDTGDPATWSIMDKADWWQNLPLCVGGAADDATAITVSSKPSLFDRFYCLTQSGEVLLFYGIPESVTGGWQYQVLRAAAIGAPPTAIADGEWISSYQGYALLGTDADTYQIGRPPLISTPSTGTIGVSFSGQLWTPAALRQMSFYTTPFSVFPFYGSVMVTSYYRADFPISDFGTPADPGPFLCGREFYDSGVADPYQVDPSTSTIGWSKILGTGWTPPYTYIAGTGTHLVPMADPDLIHPAKRMVVAAELLNSQRRRLELYSDLGTIKSASGGSGPSLYNLTTPAPTTVYNPLAVGGRRY
jgi:hypothetical protein